MKIAVVGCLHGELTKAYAAIERSGAEPELVIVCGDFQAFRTPADLLSFSAPAKYRRMGDFHEYYAGRKQAPVLTIVVGGNHEASNFLSSMPQGGWLCPNIWYAGESGIVNFRGLVIAGLSGIWYEPDFYKPRFEAEAFAADLVAASKTDALFSAYHTRKTDIDKLGQIKPQKVDIVVTHDWPRGIEQGGNVRSLLKIKPYFRSDIATHTLGNPATAPLLDSLEPQWWLSAHLHVYYRAVHGATEFMALDKVLPRRRFLSFIDVEPRNPGVEDEWFPDFNVKHFT